MELNGLKLGMDRGGWTVGLTWDPLPNIATQRMHHEVRTRAASSLQGLPFKRITSGAGDLDADLLAAHAIERMSRVRRKNQISFQSFEKSDWNFSRALRLKLGRH